MQAIEKDFSRFLCSTFKSYGLSDLLATVGSFLYIQPKEVSLEKIAAETGYSLASISNTIRMMEGIGLIQKIRKPGSKKLYVYMEKNLFKLNIQKVKAAREKTVKRAKSELPLLIEKYRKKAKGEDSKRKLAIIEDYHSYIVEFEKLLSSWERDLEALSRKRKQRRSR